ncbi:hypothetical protein N7448_005591 [Penicillium atrosanguineum]|uniref:Uncharacterized protein n=1 Tax=Penicillium atrosanguineum TaxID=1132637 RepID=A0A9W9TZV1_9EURO|nr:uncharacterized protein N7443_009323 [Penicillium atrosanguineum]KAJ5137037.1 hypothetical protein N7448_005591 [Penicillium atrosanguineum]KAJ5293370.1 hypothetical protein N7443_009323 [Penicillium atrosanguineum]KAJ5302596.1 hypothetical protein N7476_009395 [Penicillium atrosanguineum]
MTCAEKALGDCLLHSDVILAIQDPYMAQIVDGTKNYEFRRYRLKPEVKRIWFYRTAPHSSITHVCETLLAQTRNPNDVPLEEDGLGNAEFNNKHVDWNGFDFAYKMVSVYELLRPISFEMMKETYGFKAAPRGLVYLPKTIRDTVDWKQQKLAQQALGRPDQILHMSSTLLSAGTYLLTTGSHYRHLLNPAQ